MSRLLRETMTGAEHQRLPIRDKVAGHSDIPALSGDTAPSAEQIYTVFEGTSEIKRLVISRAISGMRIR